MKKSEVYSRVTCLLLGIFVFALSGQLVVLAQGTESEGALIFDAKDTQQSETVTINVKDANISEVLKAYSLQTGQSIVVGPDVVSDNVNVRLNNIPWKNALDVILKPYGFGYRLVGDTIVISRLENIISVEGIEPLDSRVFKLKFLDAYDIKAICEAQLSGRGKFTILETKGLPGWEFGGDGSSGAATESGVRTRKQKENLQKSKTFVVTDVPAAITKLAGLIQEMDAMPSQVLIEAKFLEISTGDLSDIGLEYINAVENVVDLGTTGSLSPIPLDPSLLRVLNPTTGYPDPLQTRAAGGYSQDNGIRLSHSVLGEWGADMLFALMAREQDANVLSAPSILTLNNQEAAILVGQKFPIIESQNNSGSGSTVTSTSLDYYENIGIQLNVIPQVCDEDYINMIVHPAVSEIAGFEAGVVTGGSDVQSGTQYPILRIREAETQVMIKSGSSVIIGGLQTERDRDDIKKVPLLGDIPFLGRLFRRETLTKEKIDLLIFIKGTIIDNESYASDSRAKEVQREERMDLDLIKNKHEAAAETVVAVEPSEGGLEEPSAASTSSSEKAEIVSFISESSEEDAAMKTAEFEQM